MKRGGNLDRVVELSHREERKKETEKREKEREIDRELLLLYSLFQIYMTHTYIHIVINKHRIKQDIYSHEWSLVYIIIQIYK